MASASTERAQPPSRLDDLVSTAPGTPAGRYLRSFWNPIYHSADLKSGRPVPLRIMSESFTLYRGEGGEAHLVEARCPHRGTQLSAGHVEGDALRCFYHGSATGCRSAPGRCASISA
jgi:5,5'-dehydrodivanillate O-demethylase oxygenase subunit